MHPILISSVEGNRQKLDGGSMFGNAPRTMWERWLIPDELGRIPLACRAMLIEYGDLKILCETGIGAFFPPDLANRYGVEQSERHVLLDSLADLGVDPGEIDFVILSHLHFDHAGGLLPGYSEMKKGHDGLLFENARYIVSDVAFQRCLHPHPRDRASFIPGLDDKLLKSGRLVIVEKGAHRHPDLPDFITFRYSNGHTPGHMNTLVNGQQTKVLYCGDLIPGKAWLHIPITMGYDRFPELVIDEKKEIYETAMKERWLLFFTHDSEHSAAFCDLDEKGRVYPERSFERILRLEI